MNRKWLFTAKRLFKLIGNAHLEYQKYVAYLYVLYVYTYTYVSLTHRYNTDLTSVNGLRVHQKVDKPLFSFCCTFFCLDSAGLQVDKSSSNLVLQCRPCYTLLELVVRMSTPGQLLHGAFFLHQPWLTCQPKRESRWFGCFLENCWRTLSEQYKYSCYLLLLAPVAEICSMQP